MNTVNGFAEQLRDREDLELVANRIKPCVVGNRVGDDDLADRRLGQAFERETDEHRRGIRRELPSCRGRPMFALAQSI